MSKSDEKKKFWTEELGSYRQSGLSYVKYCESKSFCASTLRYWEEKLNLGQNKKVQPSGFAKVEVNKKPQTPTLHSLPNAKWVADVIRHLAVSE